MNERIEKLAEQAGYTPLPGFDFANDLQEVFLAKFAQLIVKEMVDECAKVCVEHAGWTPRMIAEQVKQHFGVEL